ncbi:hypothetical protein [Klebsiella aerogenes EA1509E]|uniref:Uncharacterized protein n=2 Tax=Enterobacteriaceae TaxID=543 RepID=A0A7D5G063_ECOLX|nr:Hypothetical protein [Citrobacter freundii]QLG03789.1 hypothetical protein [Escherichia coli]UJJ80426.1 hypothetical protein [Klebsiella pneumoniae]CCG28702.1 hypothetical protein [Klebsiella aerogenes EA1509E]QKY87435.1 hypothetical protein [Citrobacter freundii]
MNFVLSEGETCDSWSPKTNSIQPQPKGALRLTGSVCPSYFKEHTCLI